MKPKILIIPGSRRSDSLNVKLAAHVAALIGAHDGQAMLAHLDDYTMPIYNGDLERASGLPPAALRLKRLMHECDGLAFVSPEYNASIAPLLKNAIDWASRPHDPAAGELQPFRDKPAALFAAAPGGLGGIRGLRHLRDVLNQLGALVLPSEFALAHASEALAGDILPDTAHAQMVAIAGALTRMARFNAGAAALAN